MNRRSLPLTCLALLAAAAVVSADPPGQTARPADNPGFAVHFYNGSVIRPADLVDPVEVETKFGKVTVPPGEVRRIQFGFRLTDGEKRQVEKAMADLASDNYKARQVAEKTLIDMGRLAYPSLMAARKSSDLETVTRVNTILQKIREHVPPDLLRSRPSDVVRTSDSAIAGRLTAPALRAKSELFGEVEIPLHRLREVASLIPGDELVIAVDAAKYGNMARWLESELEVSPGTEYQITASGEIDLDPVGGIGNPALTRSIRPDGTRQLASGETYFPGQLLGRVGTDGPVFAVNESYRLIADREGKLFLRIVTLEQANNIQARGEYRVKIVTEQ